MKLNKLYASILFGSLAISNTASANEFVQSMAFADLVEAKQKIAVSAYIGSDEEKLQLRDAYNRSLITVITNGTPELAVTVAENELEWAKKNTLSTESQEYSFITESSINTIEDSQNILNLENSAIAEFKDSILSHPAVQI